MKTSKITDIVGLERNRDNPILLNFQNAEMGYKNDASIECFRAEDTDRLAQAAAAAVNGSDDSKPARMAVVISDQQVYRGYLGENLPSSMNTFVAVRNRKTGKMRLIQVESCNMLNSCYDDNKNKFQDDENRLTVMRKFGGKLAIRALERIERSGSNIDVMNETLQDTLTQYDDEQFNEEGEFSKNKLEGELILASMKPPRNPAAQSVSDLYLLEDLISEPIRQNLKTVGLGLLEKDPETLELANVYLTNKVKAALQSKEPDSEANVRTLQICLFMDGLCRLLNQWGKSMEKLKVSPFSKKLDADIKQNFSQINQVQNTRTKYTEHKAITYYLALAFLLDSFILSVDQIHEGLKISRKDLLKFAAFIGGSHDSVKGILTLKMGTSGQNSRSFSGKPRYGRRK
ncbi:uncharacterized protein LOC129738532 [Uranotaenia lowii]|uniref:uncharacterized protein LOC129738532 n=1 Tax=Uranotaenia lowii TaxID=190385 RepID=UPI00247932EC|nr:uncharacterized protein LOC129738532 [Uranotaenia lowii]